jgi:protease I
MARTALIIIAQESYQDQELAGTKDALVAAGFTVVLGSTDAGTCTGKFGGTQQATLSLREIDVSQFDRIAFMGGPGAGELKDNPEGLRIARETVAHKLPLGAICIAPTILAAAGVLQGRMATVWNNDKLQQPFLESHGATYTGEAVTIDGLIITGNGPAAAEEFGQVFAGL